MTRAVLRQSLILAITIVCGVAAGAAAVAVFVAVPAAPDGHRVVRFEFGQGGSGQRLLLAGWARPDPWGVWSVGERAALRLPSLEAAGPVVLRMGLDLYLKPPKAPVQRIDISLNGEPLRSIESDVRVINRDYVFEVAPSRWQARGPNDLAIRIWHPASPQETGESGDTRKLGVGLRTLVLSYAPVAVTDE